jgi:hypothetical protein
VIGRDWPVPFGLHRTSDPSGVSGTGVVATGVIWPDRRAAMLWTGAAPPPGADRCVRQVNLFDDAAEIEMVHGHSGVTRLRRRDPAVPCADLGLAVFGILAHYGTSAAVTHWGALWDNGTAVTWASGPVTRIEQWPAGALAAFHELQDLEADEVTLRWVPHDSLRIDASAKGTDGRRWLTGVPGYGAAKVKR